MPVIARLTINRGAIVYFRLKHNNLGFVQHNNL